MAYIHRAFTETLKNRVQYSKCTLVIGARQVGKSTLIRHEFTNYNRADFDDYLTRLQAKEEPKLFFLNNPSPLFIAEVLQLRHNDVKHLLNIVAKWLHRLSLIIPLQFELPVTL